MSVSNHSKPSVPAPFAATCSRFNQNAEIVRLVISEGWTAKEAAAHHDVAVSTVARLVSMARLIEWEPTRAEVDMDLTHFFKSDPTTWPAAC